MRPTALIVCQLLIAAASAAAQTTPRWSLGGTLLSVSAASEANSVDVGLPGGGPLIFAGESAARAAPEIYAGFFPHPNIVVAPGIAFAYERPDDAASRYGLGIDLAIEWHVSGVTRSSLYVAAKGAFIGWDAGAGDSRTDLAAGAALGYRFLPYDFFALRLESDYRRYFDLAENQITGVLKAEVVFN